MRSIFVRGKKGLEAMKSFRNERNRETLDLDASQSSERSEKPSFKLGEAWKPKVDISLEASIHEDFSEPRGR